MCFKSKSVKLNKQIRTIELFFVKEETFNDRLFGNANWHFKKALINCHNHLKKFLKAPAWT